jgi:hypothetical protein
MGLGMIRDVQNHIGAKCILHKVRCIRMPYITAGVCMAYGK